MIKKFYTFITIFRTFTISDLDPDASKCFYLCGSGFESTALEKCCYYIYIVSTQRFQRSVVSTIFYVGTFYRLQIYKRTYTGPSVRAAPARGRCRRSGSWEPRRRYSSGSRPKLAASSTSRWDITLLLHTSLGPLFRHMRKTRLIFLTPIPHI
jgi:hypothetical protein